MNKTVSTMKPSGVQKKNKPQDQTRETRFAGTMERVRTTVNSENGRRDFKGSMC